MRTPLLAAVAALGLAAPAGAAAPALKVFPPAVELRGQEDRQSLVVQLVDAQGTTKDVTASAKLTFADAAVAALAGRTLSPKKDGATTLLVEADGLRAEVAVTVKFFSTPVDWRDCGLTLLTPATWKTSPMAIDSVAVPPKP